MTTTDQQTIWLCDEDLDRMNIRLRERALKLVPIQRHKYAGAHNHVVKCHVHPLYKDQTWGCVVDSLPTASSEVDECAISMRIPYISYSIIASLPKLEAHCEYDTFESITNKKVLSSRITSFDILTADQYGRRSSENRPIVAMTFECEVVRTLWSYGDFSNNEYEFLADDVLSLVDTTLNEIGSEREPKETIQ